jgi:hypothetical protein
MSSWLWLKGSQSIDHIESFVKLKTHGRQLTSDRRKLIHAARSIHGTPGAGPHTAVAESSQPPGHPSRELRIARLRNAVF